MARSLGSNKEYFGRNLKLLAGVLLSIGLFFYAEIIKNSYNIFVVHNPTTATHKQREKHTTVRRLEFILKNNHLHFTFGYTKFNYRVAAIIISLF